MSARPSTARTATFIFPSPNRRRRRRRNGSPDADDLTLVAVDATALGADLVWEPSRGGALFPHLYAPLPLSAVVWSRPLPLRPDGGHDFGSLET